MNYEIERLKGQVKINFSVSEQEWEDEINRAYNKNKGKYNIPGFRKGHATRRMIENTYGAGIFFDDAFSSCFKDAYARALDANQDIYPVDEPQIDIDDIGKDGLKFFALVTVRPEVKLGQYTGFKLDEIAYPVSEDAVNVEIDKARERLSRKVEIADREAKDGDITVIDYSGSVDGVKFDGGTAENQELILGSNSFIPGFEAQVIGMKIGETRDINVKFPDEYHAENLKGKDAVFNVKLHSIFVKELPELNDNFAKDASQFETLADFVSDIRSKIESENKRREDFEKENKIIEEVVSHTECDVPECMIDTQLNYIVEDFKNRLQRMYQGLKFEDYLKYTGTDIDGFRKAKKDEAAKAVKTRLTIEELIKAEKIDVTAADVDAKIAELAENAKKTADEFKKTLNEIQINYIKNDIVVLKIIEFLKKNNTFEVNSGKSTADTVKKGAVKAKTAEKTESAKKTDAKKTVKNKETK